MYGTEKNKIWFVLICSIDYVGAVAVVVWESVGIGVVMEAAPPAAFEVPKPDFLLEFLIVPLDAPAQLGKVDELAEADVRRQRRQPILGRSGFALGPLDQQPFLRQQFRHQLAMTDPHAHAGEARG